MYSFLKSKLQTAVVIFLTVLMVGELGLAQTGGTTSAPANNSGINNQYNPFNQENSQQTNLKQREKCLIDFEKDPKKDFKKLELCKAEISDPSFVMNSCKDFQKQMNESLAKCNRSCETEVEKCSNGGNPLGFEPTDSILNGILTQTTGFSINPTANIVNNCRLPFQSGVKPEKDKIDNEIKDLEKEVLTKLPEKENDAVTKANEEDEKYEKQQQEIKEALAKLEAEGKDKEREKYKEISNTQFKLNEQLRVGRKQVSTLRMQFMKLTNERKKMLANYSIDNISRICRGQLLKNRADECKKDPKGCQKAVYSGLGSAFISGKLTTGDNNAAFKSCIENTVLEYSQQIDSKMEEVKSMQADIQSKEEEIASIQEQSKSNESSLYQELSQMKATQNQEAQNLTIKYYTAEQRRIQANGVNNDKIMQIRRQQVMMNFQLTGKRSASNYLAQNIDGLDQNTSGSQGLEEVGRRIELKEQAKNFGCCDSPMFQNSLLCVDKAREKGHGKKSGNK